jgi:hypothetical protein
MVAGNACTRGTLRDCTATVSEGGAGSDSANRLVPSGSRKRPTAERRQNAPKSEPYGAPDGQTRMRRFKLSSVDFWMIRARDAGVAHSVDTGGAPILEAGQPLRPRHYLQRAVAPGVGLSDWEDRRPRAAPDFAPTVGRGNVVGLIWAATAALWEGIY